MSVYSDQIGIVENGKLRLLEEQSSMEIFTRLTTMKAYESKLPDSEEIDLAQYEGKAIMIRGHDQGGWIYEASVVDVAGQILTAVVKNVFNV